MRIFAAAFESQQRLGDRPALILGAQPVRLRHADIVEKHLIEFVIARERADRLDRDAGEAHVEQQKADPRLRLALVRGADKREHAVREMCVRRPYLRSIEDIILAFARRAKLPRGKGRPRPGPPKALAPTILPPNTD